MSEKPVRARTEIIRARRGAGGWGGRGKKRNPLKLQGEVCVCAGSRGLNYTGLPALPSLSTHPLITFKAGAGAWALRAGGSLPQSAGAGFCRDPGIGSSSAYSPSPSCPTGIQPGAWKGGFAPLGLWGAGKRGEGVPFFHLGNGHISKGDFSRDPWTCLKHGSCGAGCT